MERPVLIETSARHLHVDRKTLDILFGEGYELTPVKDLSQPGQFACAERVAIQCEKSGFPSVSILGPLRGATQVELSKTDARTAGADAPIRESGDIEHSGKCVLTGPKGSVELEKGVIVAKRHIHATPEDAQRYGLKDQQIVSVKAETPERSLIFGDVVVRVSEKFSLAMHIDTDEANACGFTPGLIGEIIP